MGSAATAVFADARARRARGDLVLRIEDLDTPRRRDGAEEAMLADLAWLGIHFTDGPHRQTERLGRYEATLEKLVASGETFLCDCSRAEIARAASAPHEGEEGAPYPGTCRPFGMRPRAFKRAPALRLRMDSGDFVLRRGDGVFAYQLACASDDVDMQVTEVVRGIDLVGSAARQLRIAELAGDPAWRERTFVHVPLVVSDDGSRLSKRDGGLDIATLRGRGISPQQLVKAIAIAYGFEVDDCAPLDALARALDDRALREKSIRVSDILQRLVPGERMP